MKKLDWRGWLRSIVVAFIGGGASAVVAGASLNVIDPGHFNLQSPDFYRVAFAMFGAGGALAVCAFWKKSPWPAEIEVTTTTETTVKQSNPTAIVVETVKTVQTVDKPPEK